MELNRLVLMILIGAALAIVGSITLQWFPAFIILVFIVLVLLLSDFKQWIESLVDKIISANTISTSETARLTETTESMRQDLEKIGQRLDVLEQRTYR